MKELKFLGELYLFNFNFPVLVNIFQYKNPPKLCQKNQKHIHYLHVSYHALNVNVIPGRWLWCRAYQEKEARRSIFCSDVPHCGRPEENASHRTQHVLACGSRTHQPGQDTLFFGSVNMTFSYIDLTSLDFVSLWTSVVMTVCCSVSQKDTDEEVREFLQNNLHLQGKASDIHTKQKPRLTKAFSNMNAVFLSPGW